MDIQTVKDLMEECKWGALATTDGEKVGVRPMGALKWFGNELWCATLAGSDKVKQLSIVPNAEYCFCNRDGLQARISGHCVVSSDNADKRRLYEALPMLKQFFPDPEAPEYVVIKMTPERVRVMTMEEEKYHDVEL